MLICTCPLDEDCIAWGSQMDCFPWCNYLVDDDEEAEVVCKICAVCGCRYVGASCPNCGSRAEEEDEDA